MISYIVVNVTLNIHVCWANLVYKHLPVHIYQAEVIGVAVPRHPLIQDVVQQLVIGFTALSLSDALTIPGLMEISEDPHVLCFCRILISLSVHEISYMMAEKQFHIWDTLFPQAL